MSNDFSSIPLNAKILSQTPPEVIALILGLINQIGQQKNEIEQHENQIEQQKSQIEQLEKRIVELETKQKMTSTNSSKPPSSDSPFKEKPKTPSKKDKKPREKREGFSRERLEATETHKVMPEACSCGCTSHEQLREFYTHQVVELPEIELIVEGLCIT